MKVCVKYEAYRKMVLAAKYAAPYEIAGLLYGRIDGKIVVEDADVFKIQKVTATSVNVEPDEFARHAVNLSKEQVEKAIGLWHSHGNMKAFHSSIDVETSNVLVKQINPLVAITTNASGEMDAKIYVYVDKLGEVLEIDAEAELTLEDDEELKKLIKKLKKRIERKQEKNAKKEQGNVYIGYPYGVELDELIEGAADEELDEEREWRREWRKYLEEW